VLRTLATFRLVTVVVLLAFLAGYSALALWLEEEPEYAGVQDFERPAEVAFVLPELEQPRGVREAAVRRLDRPRGTLQVRLAGSPPEGIACVVAVLDQKTGIPHARRQLATPPPESIEFSGVPAGDRWVVFGASTASLRYGYYVRKPTRVVADESTGVDLDLGLSDLVVHLVPRESASTDENRPRRVLAITPAVTRVGDPSWRRNLTNGGALPLDRSPTEEPGPELAFPVVIRSLGRGEYELAFDGFELSDGESVQVEVPAQDPLRLLGRFR
jgi:hypothetical protein